MRPGSGRGLVPLCGWVAVSVSHRHDRRPSFTLYRHLVRRGRRPGIRQRGLVGYDGKRPQVCRCRPSDIHPHIIARDTQETPLAY